uniref:B box-type domain-containing protein n=1 Tax=Ditylenchus dipsaci TaxID=166011 RepID=A0A915D8N6_9BILA
MSSVKNVLESCPNSLIFQTVRKDYLPTCQTLVAIPKDSPLPTVYLIKGLVDKAKAKKLAAGLEENSSCTSCSESALLKKLFLCQTCSPNANDPKLFLCASCMLQSHNGHSHIKADLLATPTLIQQLKDNASFSKEEITDDIYLTKQAMTDFNHARYRAEELFARYIKMCLDKSNLFEATSQKYFLQKIEVENELKTIEESTTKFLDANSKIRESFFKSTEQKKLLCLALEEIMPEELLSDSNIGNTQGSSFASVPIMQIPSPPTKNVLYFPEITVDRLVEERFGLSLTKTGAIDHYIRGISTVTVHGIIGINVSIFYVTQRSANEIKRKTLMDTSNQQFAFKYPRMG